MKGMKGSVPKKNRLPNTILTILEEQPIGRKGGNAAISEPPRIFLTQKGNNVQRLVSSSLP